MSKSLIPVPKTEDIIKYGGNSKEITSDQTRHWREMYKAAMLESDPKK